jgi:hypothetical protein
MPTASILVRDGSTRQPISGAMIFFGPFPGVATGSDGRAQITADLSSYPTVAVKLGYGTGSLIAVLSDEGFLPDIIDLQANVSPARLLTIHVLGDDAEGQSQSAIYGAQVMISGGPSAAETLFAGKDGTVLTQQKYANGNYSVSVSLAGWESISSASLVVEEDIDDYTFVLAKLSDEDSGNQPAPDTGAMTSSQLQPGVVIPNIPVPDYEFIYPSNEFGKYFTTTQARMYIGNMFVDEFNSFRMVLQDNQIPIYGYASRYFDAIGQGRSLVQGQLDINFISEGYLYTVLSEFAKAMQVRTTDAAAEQSSQFEKLRQSRVSVDNQSGKNGAGADLLARGSQLAVIDRQMDVLAAQGPQALTKVPSNPNPPNQVGLPFTNACYPRIAFDIVMVMEGANRKVVRRLEKCYLTGNEQILDQSGNPLMDSYSFIARRLR